MYWIRLLLGFGLTAAGALLRVRREDLVRGLVTWVGLVAAIALACEVVAPAALSFGGQ